MATVPRTAASDGHPSRPGAGVLEATRRRILVVDDDAFVLSSLRCLFETLDVDVDTCSDPERAAEQVQAGAYDVVISDERMPKMSGTEMLRRVRAASPRTPTILMTAYSDPASFDRAFESTGVFGYLTKPWNNRELLVTVTEALRAAQALS